MEFKKGAYEANEMLIFKEDGTLLSVKGEMANPILVLKLARQNIL